MDMLELKSVLYQFDFESSTETHVFCTLCALSSIRERVGTLICENFSSALILQNIIHRIGTENV
jgi:RNA-binding protein YlmH